MKAPRGFTLIESIVVMVVMALAMVTITSFLVPQFSRSADLHYQSRASALGHGLMTQILARSFDQHSTQLGGVVRCSSIDADSELCSGISGASSSLGPDGEVPANFNDVDDYIGCWTTSAVTTSCPNNLYDLISSGTNSAYHNFEVNIAVTYFTNTPNKMLKQVTLEIKAGQQAPLEFIAYRGNY
ncbi:MSHA pilin protein MshD [Vibrio ichthyoenteri ATCC 700023]|uniref:MSHA pilin protein MshD n=1 Tax=Vibrio ichthyoenteri ATCC 700023 TaxID=870968 RepID=F9S1I0_9VIBR|nr:prepilin-type N-terminal cleavage/methylation domain-containing protein [Vibrio ichthyoenteri]EGU41686.1 MSHA pilin protein MshD [Vibrio ichthyoenteri ATCC 700023]